MSARIAIAAFTAWLWLAPVTPAEAVAPGSLGERAAEAGIGFGTSLSTGALADVGYRRLVAGQAAVLTPENALKWRVVHPRRHRFDFSRADRLARFAVRHGMAMRGHTLLWHHRNPRWLERVRGRAGALALMREHIRRVITHFERRWPGLVVHWDVINEAVRPRGGLRRSFWMRRIGPGYAKRAFEIARRFAGPGTALYYNGYPGLDGPCAERPHCRGVKRLVRGLLRAGAPIDGVGFEAHLPGPPARSPVAATRWVGRFGLEWSLTELDVQLRGAHAGAGPAAQAQAFGDVTAACAADPACRAIVLWGLSDRWSWWNGRLDGALADATPFDRGLDPKPAVDAIAAALGPP